MDRSCARPPKRHARKQAPAANAEQGGFTLVEVVVAMTVLGIIGAALVALVVVVFGGSGTAGTISTDARDEQLLATYFVRDIASAAPPSATGLLPPSVNTDLSSMMCRDFRIDQLGTNPVVEIRHQASGTTYWVDYYWQAVPSTSSSGTLHRRTCRSRSRGGTSLIGDEPIVRNLNLNALDPPVQSSMPASCASCWTITLEADHPYSITADQRTYPPTTTTTETPTTSTTEAPTTTTTTDGATTTTSAPGGGGGG